MDEEIIIGPWPVGSFQQAGSQGVEFIFQTMFEFRHIGPPALAVRSAPECEYKIVPASDLLNNVPAGV